MKKIDLYFEAIDIFNKIGERKSELSDENLGFICGLIKEYKPKIIVELGVSAGGTSCVILNCLEKLNIDSKVFSVDLSYNCHLDISKKCGYQIEDAAQYLNNMKNHKLILGKTIAETILDIAKYGKIDLLILDTIHYLPGEVLDFLICLPYMAENAITIVDDLIFSHMGENTWAIATKILFDTVVADKYMPNSLHYPNMAAFQLNEDSKKYQIDCFSALLTPWFYEIDTNVIDCYKKIIDLNYSEEEKWIFNESLKLNRDSLKKKSIISQEIQNILRYLKREKDILIYGAGTRGLALKYFLEDRGGEIVKGFVISDDRNKENFAYLNMPIFYLSEIRERAYDYTIIVALHSEDVRKKLREYDIDYIDTPNFIFPFIKEYVDVLLREN